MASSISSNIKHYALKPAEIRTAVGNASLGHGELGGTDDYFDATGSHEDRRTSGYDSFKEPDLTSTLDSHLQDLKLAENARRERHSTDTLTFEAKSPESRRVLCIQHLWDSCRQGKDCFFSHELSSVELGFCLEYARRNCEKGLECSLHHPNFAEDTFDPLMPSQQMQAGNMGGVQQCGMQGMNPQQVSQLQQNNQSLHPRSFQGEYTEQMALQQRHLRMQARQEMQEMQQQLAMQHANTQQSNQGGHQGAPNQQSSQAQHPGQMRSHPRQVVRNSSDLQLDDQIGAAGAASDDQSHENTSASAPRRRLSQSDSGTGANTSLSLSSANEEDIGISAFPAKQPGRLPATQHDPRDINIYHSLPCHQSRENLRATPPVSPTLSTRDIGRDKTLHQQVFDSGKGELFYTLTRSQDPTRPKTAILNIATLQHMALHSLQYDISQYVGQMYDTSTFLPALIGFPPLRELMTNYCDAVRNLDFMTQSALRGYEEDPFLMKSSRALERRVMGTASLLPNHVLPGGPLPIAQDHEHPKLRETGRNAANEAACKKKRLLRFAMAALGGLLLVIPMIIMTIVVGKTASLVTTCVSMLIFAILISVLTELGPNEVLGTTAAYAAVLVVFVGTSLDRTDAGARW
ncbi:hypothetical protein LTR37_014861 [Vermiconidia calcicola]|uniref:Uncharacterized protein n=1 Tax=Vermiconidia calcicola TaxID=1690605 RepID=A0ACC3MT62_9PEZI|nr:hypothetical protein LTR37_014861 [Vermiconidia calcicola]